MSRRRRPNRGATRLRLRLRNFSERWINPGGGIKLNRLISMFRETSACARKYGTFDQVLMSLESPQQNRLIFTLVDRSNDCNVLNPAKAKRNQHRTPLVGYSLGEGGNTKRRAVENARRPTPNEWAELCCFNIGA